MQRTANRRFPFRIVIEQSGTILLELTLVSKPDPSYNAVPVEQEIREFALALTGDPFATADIAARFPGVPTARVLRVLGQLEAEGLLMRIGRRRGLRWKRRAIAEPVQGN